MWHFTKYGFFSAVCARQGDGKKSQPVDPNRVMVRARLKEHLEALVKRFPKELGKAEIREGKQTDYRFRVFLEKKTWAVVVASMVLEMTYDNFKNECHAFQPTEDGGYVGLLHRVWGAAYAMQSASYGPGMYDRPKKVVGGHSLFDNDGGATATDTETGGIRIDEPEMDERVIVVRDQDTGKGVVIIWWPELYDSDESAYAMAVKEGDAPLVAHPEFERCPWYAWRFSSTKIFDSAYAEVEHVDGEFDEWDDHDDSLDP